MGFEMGFIPEPVSKGPVILSAALLFGCVIFGLKMSWITTDLERPHSINTYLFTFCTFCVWSLLLQEYASRGLPVSAEHKSHVFASCCVVTLRSEEGAPSTVRVCPLQETNHKAPLAQMSHKGLPKTSRRPLFSFKNCWMNNAAILPAKTINFFTRLCKGPLLFKMKCLIFDIIHIRCSNIDHSTNKICCFLRNVFFFF